MTGDKSARRHGRTVDDNLITVQAEHRKSAETERADDPAGGERS